MRSLQILLTLFGAIGLLLLGSTGAMASPAAPCHAMSGMVDPAPADAPAGHPSKSPKTLAAMSCCIACVAGHVYRPAPAAAPLIVRAAVAAAPQATLTGRSPSPEPGPPRA